MPSVTLSNPGIQSSYDGDMPTIALIASDSAANTLNYSAVNLPTGLSIVGSGGSGTSGYVLIGGTIASTADAGGPYTVVVSATDPVTSESASVIFTWIVSQPTVTVANPLDHENLDGDRVSVGIFATDTAIHTLTYSASGLPSGLSINSSTGVISGTIGSTADASGPYSVTVSAADSAAAVSASTTFNWAVDPLVSVTAASSLTNCEGDSVALDIQALDAGGGTLSYTASGLPSGLSIDSTTGVISGTVASGASADSPYFVTVTATDDSTSIAVSQSITWSIAAINIVNPGSQTNLDGDTVSLALSGSASYVGTHTFAFSATGLPSGLSINSSTGVISGTIADDADATGPYHVTVTYTDETADISASHSFHWHVHAPTTSDLALSTTPDTATAEIDLTQQSNNPDDPSMTVNIVSGPSHGTLAENVDGTYTYTPGSGWSGTDTFTFTVTVGDLTSTTSTATVTVAADVPTIGGDLSYTDLPGQVLTLDDLMTNGSDAGGKEYTAVIVSGPSNGSVALNSSGVEVYTPSSGFTGSDSFTYELSNGWHTSSTATVSIDVTSSSPLVANSVVQETGENQPLTITPSSLLTKDMSASSGSLSICSFTQPSDGTLTVDRNGNLVYTPGSSYTGADSFTCLLTDGTNFETETVALAVQPNPSGESFTQERAIPGATAASPTTIQNVRTAANGAVNFTFATGVGAMTGLEAREVREIGGNRNATSLSFNIDRAEITGAPGVTAYTSITAAQLTNVETAVRGAIETANPTVTRASISVTTYATVTLIISTDPANAALRNVRTIINVFTDYSYTTPGPPITTFQSQVLILRTPGAGFTNVVNVNQGSSTVLR